jgi:hypothetical protein
VAPTTGRTGASRYGPRSVSSTLARPPAPRLRTAGGVRGRAALPGPRSHAGGARRGERLPDWPDFAATIVTGGPMGAFEEAPGASMRSATSATRPKPVIRSGASAWSAAARRRAGRARAPGEEAELCLLPVELTAAARQDPVFAGAPSSFPTLQWHGDSFDLPEGATLLASSAGIRTRLRYESASGARRRVGRRAGIRSEPGEDSGSRSARSPGRGGRARQLDDPARVASSGACSSEVARVPAQTIG